MLISSKFPEASKHVDMYVNKYNQTFIKKILGLSKMHNMFIQQGPMADLCEPGDELSGYIKARNILSAA
jgi:hypothetical protein